MLWGGRKKHKQNPTSREDLEYNTHENTYRCTNMGSALQNMFRGCYFQLKKFYVCICRGE
jgi:hypothetical protein